MSPYLDSGSYTIVAFVDGSEEKYSDRGVVLGETAYSAHPRTFETTGVNPEQSYDVIWGGVIALSDFEVVESETGTLDVAVRWHVLERPQESYKVFAHLIDADSGEIASQVDAIPRNWTYPTDWWEADEIITDTLSIPLNDVGPHRFEVWLGFYDEDGGERLPLVDPNDVTLSTNEDAVKVYEYAQ